jgi:hypothetical protein
MSGSRVWKPATMREIVASMKKGTPPSRTCPAVPFTCAVTASEALRDAARIMRPCAASWRPSAVAWSGRRPRRNSGSPTRASSIERDRLTAGWVSPRSAAPSDTPPESITAASCIR